MHRLALVFLAVVLAGVSVKPGVIRADGALAIGSTAEDDGYGFAIGKSSAGIAQSDALAECRETSAAPDCRIVETFSKKCVAVAFAPENVTGFGWSVADTLQLAEQQAKDRCTAQSDGARQQGCTIDASGCD